MDAARFLLQRRKNLRHWLYTHKKREIAARHVSLSLAWMDNLHFYNFVTLMKNFWISNWAFKAKSVRWSSHFASCTLSVSCFWLGFINWIFSTTSSLAVNLFSDEEKINKNQAENEWENFSTHTFEMWNEL